MKKFLVTMFILLTFLQGLSAQDNDAGVIKTRGDYLTIKAAVIGPGDALYFWWGHFGLIIEDSLTGRSSFYDYGVFSFSKDNFYKNFAFGRLYYMSAVSQSDRNLSHYVNTNRDITLYTLALSAAQKELIMREAEYYALPENSEYLYNHFKDNCVTRIINSIDKAVGGEFYAYAKNTPGRMTLREHVRRHTYFNPFCDWLLNFLMGQDIDTPTTIYQEMFLPSEAGERLNDFYYTDANGNKQKLVSNVEVVSRSTGRPPVLDKPRLQWPGELIFALIVGSVLYFLGIKSRETNGGEKKLKASNEASTLLATSKCTKVCYGFLSGFVSLFFALAGTMAFFMTFFTDHDYTFHNMNVMFINPLLLIAVAPAFIFAFSKNTAKNIKRINIVKAVWTYVFFAAILSILLKLLPMFYQENYVTLAMILPISLSLSFIPEWLRQCLKRRKIFV
ncbi:hypothetical protein FACS1894102_7230 [Spirochaetia bacterium]|nr:hypothetical protein FACS1894102_7230 [Spirochaetia bacterium]